MPNQGHWASGDVATPDKLNSGMLQKGAMASFSDAFTGMEVWDDSTGAVYRAKGSGLGWDTVIPVDGAAATPSLRTLGTGAQQAAAGDHTHTPSSIVSNTQESADGATTQNDIRYVDLLSNNPALSASPTFTGSQRTRVVTVAGCGAQNDASSVNGTLTVKIFIAAVEKAARSKTLPGNGGGTTTPTVAAAVTYVEANAVSGQTVQGQATGAGRLLGLTLSQEIIKA